MLSKLDEFQILMGLNNEFMPQEYYDDMYHYTSPRGLEGILFGNSQKAIIWASRYDCLNDKSEGTIAEKIFAETCKNLRMSGEISEELFSVFSTVKPIHARLICYHEEDQIKSVRTEFARYVCSFSKNEDSLAMWNYYSKGSKYEGFNIGMNASLVNQVLTDILDCCKAEFHIYPVIYEREEQERLVKSLLLKLRDLYTKDQATSIRYIISHQLADWGLIFKSEYFKHEEEARIIIDVSNEEKKIPVKHRISSGYIIPYIELELEKYAVVYTGFGPLQCHDENKEQQAKVMKEMLNSNEYWPLVGYSKIPVRY